MPGKAVLALTFLTAIALPAADGPAILAARCLACHSGATAAAKLDLTSLEAARKGGLSGPSLLPGNPDASPLYQRVAKGQMPPANPLPQEERDALRTWIAEGAPWGRTLAAPADERPRSGPEWWAWQPLAKAAPPAPAPAAPARWHKSPIDLFLLQAMAAKGLSPNPPASRAGLIRRVTYDLTGLPPTPEETAAFLADPAPDSYERLVDRLLASPAYGEKWGRHWLDVVRFGESNGYEQNHLRDRAWPYRDWVIRAFNQDMPFNRMILEQIAGDRIAPGNPDVEAATGFLVAGPHDTVGIQNKEGELQKRANHLDDIITGTASAFLGLTVHCARCHDHKFDPIQTKDYYRMQAAFAGVWHDERPWTTPDRIAAYEAAAAPLQAEEKAAKQALDRLRDAATSRVEAARESVLSRYRPSVSPAGSEERFAPVEARFVRMTITSPTARRNIVDLDEFEVYSTTGQNVALTGRASAKSERLDDASPHTYSASNLIDGKFDKRWISAGGMPEWVMVELPRPERFDRVFWSSDRLMGFQGRFARSIPENYRIEVSPDGKQWTQVASSEGRLPYSDEDQERLLLFAVFTPEEKADWEAAEARREDARTRLAKLEKPRRAFLGRFTQPEEPSFVMVRGNPMDKGDEIAPASLTTLGDLLEGFELPPDAAESERRLALAHWIAADANTLTARVIVNRVWMYHFGRPLVRNPSDFGYNGGEPSHPKLLDWLAARLVRDHNWKLKPLHRDLVLSAAYRQSSEHRPEAARIDGDSQFLWRFPPRRLTAEEVRDSILAASGKLDRTMGGPGFRLYRYTVDNVATYYPLDNFGPETYRRAVYHQHARSVKPELLGQFDCPETSLPAPKRETTTTPLQALSLLNHGFMLDQARFFAERLKDEAGSNPAAQAERAFHLAFNRAPDDAERTAAVRFIESQGLEIFCRALFNANEFVYVF